MTVVVVKGPTGCTDACKEWISAEGTIYPNTNSVFRKVLKSIGNRHVPITINSPGGNVGAALAIGRMLRSRHLDVSVTKTIFDGCNPTDSACSQAAGFKGYAGMVRSNGAYCASACAYVLAGGEHRYVSYVSLVGVHAITTFERRISRQYQIETRTENGKSVEVGRKLVSEKVSDPFKLDARKSRDMYFKQLADYYKEMGIGDHLIDLTFATQASSIHFMTRTELAETHLMTEPLGGEALVGTSSSPTQEQVPITSVKQLQWTSQVPPSVLPVPTAEPPVHLFPVIPEPSATPDAVAATVPLNLTKIAPTPPPVPSVTLTPVKPPAPVPENLTTPTLFQEKIIQDQSAVRDMAIAEDYFIDLRFNRYKGADGVTWFATVRKSLRVLPRQQVALRLEFPDGHISSSGAAAAASSDLLAISGRMSLPEYCELANSALMRLHLAASPFISGPLRELTRPTRAFAVSQPIWPECGSIKSASAPAQSGTSGATAVAKPTPSP